MRFVHLCCSVKLVLSALLCCDPSRVFQGPERPASLEEQRRQQQRRQVCDHPGSRRAAAGRRVHTRRWPGQCTLHRSSYCVTPIYQNTFRSKTSQIRSIFGFRPDIEMCAKRCTLYKNIIVSQNSTKKYNKRTIKSVHVTNASLVVFIYYYSIFSVFFFFFFFFLDFCIFIRVFLGFFLLYFGLSNFSTLK